MTTRYATDLDKKKAGKFEVGDTLYDQFGNTVYFCNFVGETKCRVQYKRGGYGVLSADSILAEDPNAKPISLPKNAIGYCHYCGAPACKFGSFDEPTCSDCR